MKYEITIRELEQFTKEEQEEVFKGRSNLNQCIPERFSDRSYHEVRVVHAELSKDEFQAVKKAIIEVM